MLKRIFDLGVSAIGLLILSPVLLFLALTIKLTSAGPVLYRGIRAGRYGKPFRILKFRSMVLNAEILGGPSTSDVDPRITRVGSFMRKLKLDELPQLLNVLVGEMSLVGPRPQVLDYVARYDNEEQLVLQIRPGITDWASIWNSDEGAVLAQAEDPDKAYDELIHPTKMKLQLLYARDHGLRVDLKILAYTVYGLLNRNWIPPELRDYPKPLCNGQMDEESFVTVTELPGAPVNGEQMQMLHTRYGWASDFVEGKEVLEVACGSGIGLSCLAKKAQKVTGGDYDPKLVQLASEQGNDEIRVFEMDAQSLPFPDGFFDVVILFEAIYYLSRPDDFIREAYRVLRPGGKVLICSANCERSEFNVSPFSVQYYSAEQLRAMLISNGFQAEVYAGFSTQLHGVGEQIRDRCRRLAVRLRLIPRTMKWKARIKRLFFGKLRTLPVELAYDPSQREEFVRVSPGQSARDYKVIYAVGSRVAMESRLAA